MSSSWKRFLVFPIFAAFVLSQGTWVLAGTTGVLRGTIEETTTAAPIAGATVTANSPSGNVTTTSDAAGHFAFLSLSPDTYTVDVQKTGYQEQSLPGVSVFADATQVVTLRLDKSLKTIANVTARAAGNLVKPGTTSDVYSVNAATQEKVSAVGGGGGLNNAYSAIATIPGAYVPMNQQGYFQTVHVRGGDYDQLGYEVDGVPVNRSFDNYPGGTASSLGQQELQVYTGATPANAEGQGLAGYINQVIKTGTYPGYAEATLGIGGPSYYHKAAVDTGGASPDRTFSYYVGVGGYNNDNFLYLDRNQGNQYTADWGNVIDQNPNTGAFLMTPINTFAASGLANRDVVVNFHFAIPHKHDGARDDIQLLYNNQFLKTTFYDSTNDVGANLYANSSIGLPSYYDGLVYTGGLGQVLAPGSDITGSQATYYFPSSSSPARCAAVPAGFANACPAGVVPFIDPNARDTIYNDQGIVKLQYQKNFGSTAFLRVYGYTFYSDWLQTGPQSAFANFFGPSGPDYRLDTHTYGASASYVRQLTAQHLITAQASYTGANSLRDNNRTYYDLFGFGGAQTDLAVLVSSAHPTNGLCYDAAGGAQTCDPSIGNASFVHFGDTTVPAIAPGTTCDGAPCQYITVENGLAGLYNKVKPEFTSYSVTDEFRPNDRVLLNIGLREDDFKFVGADTTGPMRAFWFSAYNLDKCVDPTTGSPVDKSVLGAAPTTSCSTIPLAGGGTYVAPNLINASGQVLTYHVFQPRLSATYTLNPDTVLRGSVGRYVEPPNTAYEQYSAQQQDIADLLGSRFYKFGFNTPGHQVYPPTSFNADLSLEKHLRGTDWSYKLTPFYRHTRNQIQNFFLDQRTGFVSGLNVGSLTAKGVEFQLNKGDFNRNGLSGLLSFTYTDATIRYGTLANGTTILSQTNQDIKNYNAYTSFCAANPNDSRCSGGTTASGAAPAPCYTTAGAPVPTAAACVGTDVANPYWNAPVQALIDPNQDFQPYDIFPGGIGTSSDSYNVPYVATFVLNYKHDRLSITPSLQYAAGNRYGNPETVPGVAPESCTATLGALASDPRYPYGGFGSSYDNSTCGAQLTAIPDPFTGHFDLPGEFRNPAQLALHLQLGYDVSPRVRLTATFANIVNHCWGGTGPGTAALNNKDVCSYGILGSAAGAIPPFGNAFNPGDPAYTSAPAFLKYPYEPSFGSFNADGNSTKQPFQFFVEARIKL